MKFWFVFFSVVLSVSASSSAFAQDWRCRNNDLEISCAGKKCESNSSFTPMNVEISRSGAVRVCAYSGCREGKGKLHHTGQLLTVVVPQLKSSPPNAEQDTRSIAIIIDAQDKVGVMKLDSYAQPLTCE